MRARRLVAIGLAGFVLGGCQSDTQILANEQAVATQAALRRGQFEMNCPQASATLLSSNFLQPVMWRGLERAEYTFGVAGCGERRTYIVVCQVGGPACFAASAR